MKPRIVFDTNTVVSALVFAAGRLAWLLGHWRFEECVPLLSRETATELDRVLRYSKFRLSEDERVELLGDYLPFCEIVDHPEACPQACRDLRDQPFLDLAFGGNADVLVTGDADLLSLGAQTRFSIEAPQIYAKRFKS